MKVDLVALLCLAPLGNAFLNARNVPRSVPRNIPAVSQLPMMMSDFVSGETCSGERVVIAGATGYIGKAVVRESIRRGYSTTALVRDAAAAANEPAFKGGEIVAADVCDADSLSAKIKGADVVISCLASRSGMKDDAEKIDYQATLNCLNAAREGGARHFVLLSAFCVAKPWLQFQFSKLKFEAELTGQSDITYSIVRPTAFFKSVSGQVEVVKGGSPFVYFDLGGGRSATCNPISEPDLAVAMIDCIANPAKKNQIWNIGGPDEGYSMEAQGKMISKIVGKEEPWLLPVPIGIFDVIIDSLQWISDMANSNAVLKERGWSKKFSDAAEFGRIGKYYAVEDMLTLDPEERFGEITLKENYEKIAVEGQEYDPYTTMFAKAKA